MAAFVVTALAGCGATSGDCQIADPCGPVVDAAFASLQDTFAERASGWVVVPTEVRLCMEGDPLYDVTFRDDVTNDYVEVTVARTEDGQLVACTY
ncbi:MAG: hypothetical protein M3Y40_08985 [Chloroflexota bacterium]|nr:hypothetical protein [Chloroflexota bacterium]